MTSPPAELFPKRGAYAAALTRKSPWSGQERCGSFTVDRGNLII